GYLSILLLDPINRDFVLRVDVLQTIGASLGILALLQALGAPRQPAAYLGLAGVVLAATPWLAGLDVAGIPASLRDYWIAVPALSPTARFPLFPWLAYPLLAWPLGRRLASQPRLPTTWWV